MSERPTPDLTIIETRVYRGANVWSYEKSIHLVVELGSLEEFPTNTLPGFSDELAEATRDLRQLVRDIAAADATPAAIRRRLALRRRTTPTSESAPTDGENA